jgi:hypothetical protein
MLIKNAILNLRLDVRLSVSGFLFQIKGHPEGLHDVVAHIEPQRPAVTICPFGRPDFRGHFTPDHVWIEDREDHIIEDYFTTPFLLTQRKSVYVREKKFISTRVYAILLQ